MKKFLVVEHDGDNATVEAFGYEGKGCAEEVKRLVRAVGSDEGGKRKAEYYLTPKQAMAHIAGRMGR